MAKSKSAIYTASGANIAIAAIKLQKIREKYPRVTYTVIEPERRFTRTAAF